LRYGGRSSAAAAVWRGAHETATTRRFCVGLTRRRTPTAEAGRFSLRRPFFSWFRRHNVVQNVQSARQNLQNLKQKYLPHEYTQFMDKEVNRVVEGSGLFGILHDARLTTVLAVKCAAITVATLFVMTAWERVSAGGDAEVSRIACRDSYQAYFTSFLAFGGAGAATISALVRQPLGYPTVHAFLLAGTVGGALWWKRLHSKRKKVRSMMKSNRFIAASPSPSSSSSGGVAGVSPYSRGRHAADPREVLVVQVHLTMWEGAKRGMLISLGSMLAWLPLVVGWRGVQSLRHALLREGIVLAYAMSATAVGVFGLPCLAAGLAAGVVTSRLTSGPASVKLRRGE